MFADPTSYVSVRTCRREVYGNIVAVKWINFLQQEINAESLYGMFTRRAPPPLLHLMRPPRNLVCGCHSLTPPSHTHTEDVSVCPLV